jgi:threonine/homoserine/homoserine lactone efflux protein
LLGSAYLAFLFFQLVSHKQTLETEEGELMLGAFMEGMDRSVAAKNPGHFLDLY